MINSTRRDLLAASAALALSAAAPAFAEDKPKLDLADLATAPEEGDMAVGPDTAKVTLIEYGSASCPHCAAFYKDVYLKLKTDYIDKGTLKFIFREYPHNDQGLAAFMVARCAPKEKYFPLLDAFFTTQDKWVPDAFNGLKNIAQQAGMSAADFEACLKNQKVVKGILDVRDKASKSYGIQGIPTLFINGKTYEGDRTFDAMKAYIDPLLK
jgi:protein-disulfide isomerase